MRLVTGVLATVVLVATACSPDGMPHPGDPVAGAVVLDSLDLSCGLCHTLEGAELTGTVGPNLDDLGVGYERTLTAIRNGPGYMPSYRSYLSEREMRDLAAHVSGMVRP